MHVCIQQLLNVGVGAMTLDSRCLAEIRQEQARRLSGYGAGLLNSAALRDLLVWPNLHALRKPPTG